MIIIISECYCFGMLSSKRSLDQSADLVNRAKTRESALLVSK